MPPQPPPPPPPLASPLPPLPCGNMNGWGFGCDQYVGAVSTRKCVSMHTINCNKLHINTCYKTLPGVSGPCEGNTHAATGVAGANCRLIKLTGKLCEVGAYSDQHATLKDVPVANVATAFTHPDTGKKPFTFLTSFCNLAATSHTHS